MKKIYKIIMLCAMSFALVGCSKRNFEKEINEAIEVGNFTLAHTVLADSFEDYKKEGGVYAIEEAQTYVNCLIKLYTSEVDYLIEQMDNDCSERVVALYKEFEGKQKRDVHFIKMTDEEFATHILDLAISTKNDFLIEKCLSSIGVYSPKSIQYILTNNDEGENIVMTELWRMYIFPWQAQRIA